MRQSKIKTIDSRFDNPLLTQWLQYLRSTTIEKLIEIAVIDMLGLDSKERDEAVLPSARELHCVLPESVKEVIDQAAAFERIKSALRRQDDGGNITVMESFQLMADAESLPKSKLVANQVDAITDLWQIAWGEWRQANAIIDRSASFDL